MTSNAEPTVAHGAIDRRVVVGLKNAPDLNNVVVNVLGDEKEGRVPCEVAACTTRGGDASRARVELNVKPQNLRALEPEDEEALYWETSQPCYDSGDDEEFGGMAEHPEFELALKHTRRERPTTDVHLGLDALSETLSEATRARTSWPANQMALVAACAAAQMRRRTGRAYLQECAGYRQNPHLWALYVAKCPVPGEPAYNYANRFAGMTLDKAARVLHFVMLAVGDNHLAKTEIIRQLAIANGGAALRAVCEVAAPLLTVRQLAGRPPWALASAAGVWPEGHAFCDNSVGANIWSALACMSSGAVPGTPAPPEILRFLMQAGVGMAVKRRLLCMDNDYDQDGEPGGQPFAAHFKGEALKQARKATTHLIHRADRLAFEDQLAEQDDADQNMLLVAVNLCTIPEGCALFLDMGPPECSGCLLICLGNYFISRSEQALMQMQKVVGGGHVMRCPIQADFLHFHGSAISKHRRETSNAQGVSSTEGAFNVTHTLQPPLISTLMIFSLVLAESHSTTPHTLVRSIVEHDESLKAFLDEAENAPSQRAREALQAAQILATCSRLPSCPDQEVVQAFLQEDNSQVEYLISRFSSMLLLIESCISLQSCCKPIAQTLNPCTVEQQEVWDWSQLIQSVEIPKLRMWVARVKTLRARALLMGCRAPTPSIGLACDGVAGDPTQLSAVRWSFLALAEADAASAIELTCESMIKTQAESILVAAAAARGLESIAEEEECVEALFPEAVTIHVANSQEGFK